MPQPDAPISVITVTGAPGIGIPAASVITTTEGEILVTEQPACIGPDGTVRVLVRSIKATDETKARLRPLRTRYDLIRFEGDWWS